MAARVDQDLAAELGVSAAVVQATAAEHLREGEHVEWLPAQGGQKRKAYTDAGLSLLRSLLATAPLEKIAEKSPPEGPEEKPAVTTPPAEEKPASGPQVRCLTILKIFPNPIWVLVQTPEKKTAEVRVRHSRLLVPGKGLRCAATEAGSWECADPQFSIHR